MLLKRSAALLTLGISLVGTGSLRAQQPAEHLRVTADNANLRVAPSIDSAIVRAIARGTVVTVLARDGAWLKVQAPNAVGWARGSQFAAIVDTMATIASTLPREGGSAPRSGRPPDTPRPTAPTDLQRERSGIHGGLGVVAGASVATLAFSGGTGALVVQHNTGFAAGIAVVPGGSVGIEIDATFVQQGFVVSDGTTKQSVATGDVGGTVLLHVAMGSRSISAFLVAGPFAAYEVRCQESVSSASGFATNSCADDSNFDGHRQLDYGAVTGAGMRLGPIALQMRYQIGLRDLYTDGAGGHGKTRSLQLLVGFTL